MTLYFSEPGTRREIGWKPTGWAFIDFFLIGIMNARLLSTITRRDVTTRYKGAALGALWMIGSPLAMVAAYSFVIAGVFGMRVGAGDSVKETIIGLWACLAAWQLFAETSNRSSSLMIDNAALVKRTSFPLALLPIAAVITAGLGVLVSYSLVAMIYICLMGVPPLTWLLMPIPFVSLAIFALGVSYLLVSIGTFVRDVRHAVPLCVQVGMLVSPILYPADRIPSALAWLSAINPLTPIFETIRALMLGNISAPWEKLAAVTIVGIVISVASFTLFRKRTPEFADVV
jgi:ABC-type polysaccharide/polyol phosphate export systems, permease component